MNNIRLRAPLALHAQWLKSYYSDWKPRLRAHIRANYSANPRW